MFFYIFHVLQLPPDNRRTDIIEIGDKAVIMAESLTPASPSKKKIREKSGSGKSGKKSGYQIFLFLVRFSEWTIEIVVLW